MSKQVQDMFGRIAKRYDRANAILSFGVHGRWRRKAVHLSQAKPGDRVLDVACGTGDLTFAFSKAIGSDANVLGLDYTGPMLEVAVEKSSRRGRVNTFSQGDCMALPFADDAFDVASISFGIRNVDDPIQGVRDLARVVRPGGRVVILEFGQPKGLFGTLFAFYSRHVMPRIGKLITGDKAAYEYLPRTAAAFPSGAQFVDLMREAHAFQTVKAKRLTGGIAWIYVGTV